MEQEGTKMTKLEKGIDETLTSISTLTKKVQDKTFEMAHGDDAIQNGVTIGTLGDLKLIEGRLKTILGEKK